MELRDAISRAVAAVVDAVRRTLEITPAELVTDMMTQGIAIAGGGALLPGLDRRVSQETRFPAYVAESPLTCVVRGCTEALMARDTLNTVDARSASSRRS